MSDTAKQSTLLRGFMIAEKIVNAERPVCSAYLAEELNLPKATVHRIAQQLEEAALLQREPGGKKFTGGKRLQELALAILSNSTLNAHRSDILQSLSREVGETCSLNTLHGNELVYLERAETHWPQRVHIPIETHVPLHCTATGKLFLANLKPACRKRMLKTLTLTPHTDLTITDSALLEEELDKIAEEQVSYNMGEYLEGMVGIAVPVFSPAHQMDFAIAIHAPSTRKSIPELLIYLPILRHAAAQLATAEYATDV